MMTNDTLISLIQCINRRDRDEYVKDRHKCSKESHTYCFPGSIRGFIRSIGNGLSNERQDSRG